MHSGDLVEECAFETNRPVVPTYCTWYSMLGVRKPGSLQIKLNHEVCSRSMSPVLEPQVCIQSTEPEK